MTRSSIRRHFRTFAASFRRLLLLIGVMCRVAVWLSPRVAMVLVLVMGCQLVWIVLIPGPHSDRSHGARPSRDKHWSASTRSDPSHHHGCGATASVSRRARWIAGRSSDPGSTLGEVCNMHAQNFSEIVRRLKLQAVEIQLLDEGRLCHHKVRGFPAIGSSRNRVQLALASR